MGRSEGFPRRWAGYVLPGRNTMKNAPLHASRVLMVALPCLDHLYDHLLNCSYVKQ